MSYIPAVLFHSRIHFSRAERGLSNYLIFERVKQDPKIAKHAAKMDKFADNEKGELIRVPEQTTQQTALR